MTQPNSQHAVIISDCVDLPPIADWLRELGFAWPESRRYPRLGFGGKTYDLAVLPPGQGRARSTTSARCASSAR
jgi:hypothetical protein